MLSSPPAAAAGHQVLTRPVGRRCSIRSRMSSTRQPLVMQRTGLRSASTSSGTSASRRVKPRMSSRSASRSSGRCRATRSARRRRPRRSRWLVGSGVRCWRQANAAVSVRRACSPPRPTAITEPRSRSLTVPTSMSEPGAPRAGRSPRSIPASGRTRRWSSRQPDRTAEGPSSPSSTAPMSLACAERQRGFQCHRAAAFPGDGDRALELAAAMRGGHRDSMRGQQRFRLTG